MRPESPMDKNARGSIGTLGWTLVVLGGALALCCLGGAAIALPDFMKFESKSRQAECKANLKGLYTAERAWFAENQKFSSSFKAVGFDPEPGNRYAYFIGTSGSLSHRNASKPPALTETDDAIGVDLFRYPGMHEGTAADVPFAIGVFGKCPDCQFIAACVGNIDNDATLDIWSISSADRPGIPAGTANLERDDTKL